MSGLPLGGSSLCHLPDPLGSQNPGLGGLGLRFGAEASVFQTLGG